MAFLQDDDKTSAHKFIDYVWSSPTAYHAVRSAAQIVEAGGFERLSEREEWNLRPGGKYYFTRNQSSLCAFIIPTDYKPGNGFNLIGAHTDSPHLKIKPLSKTVKEGYLQVDVEPYGGGLWTTWFDRDLGIAGRVIVQEDQGVVSKLVRIGRPVVRIPTLCVHLDRESGAKLEFNKQTQMVPVLATAIKEELNQKDTNMHSSLVNLLAEELKCKPEQIRDFELELFDCVKGALGGIHEEFIFMGRLDNLLSSYCSLVALTQLEKLPEKNVSGILLFDNEEVGSASAYGAASPLINELVKRVTKNDLLEPVAKSRSFFLSADMAHAIHPNYPEKHEKNHKPEMHRGIVIKWNANQRYATTSSTAFLLKEIARVAQVPIQEFVVRSDFACGSTIGPIVSTSTGIRTVDLGVAQLSMHSIREMCGTTDVKSYSKLMWQFFSSFTKLDESFTQE